MIAYAYNLNVHLWVKTNDNMIVAFSCSNYTISVLENEQTLLVLVLRQQTSPRVFALSLLVLSFEAKRRYYASLICRESTAWIGESTLLIHISFSPCSVPIGIFWPDGATPAAYLLRMHPRRTWKARHGILSFTASSSSLLCLILFARFLALMASPE